MAAPFFIAPIIAFLKSSIVIKAIAPLVAFLKTSIISKAFVSIAASLKSSTVVKAISVISRVALSIVAPLRLQARRILRWWHGHDHFVQLRAAREAAGHKHHTWHFRRTTLILLSAPVVLLSVALLASLERTPVCGRLRVIMMSTDEEACLVEAFLRPGSPPGAHLAATVPRDWLAILRAALGEDAGPPGTLMGMSVLDPRTDARARWVMDVFAQLEDGVKRLNLTSEDVYNVLDVGETRIVVPPVKYPLTIRPASLRNHGHSEDEAIEGPLITRYGCLVVDSPICNAFSLGFGPALKSESNKYEEAPGVVVIYTGLLDEILGKSNRVSEPVLPNPSVSSVVFGVFQQAASIAPPASAPAAPSKHESDQLASTLAHELGHLLLSHSLETWASNSMYELLGTLTTDLVRTVLYPLTAFLGPVFNDWFGEQIRVNSRLGLSLSSSCESRKAEFEADLVGLRVLVGAKIDPRVARDVWRPGGMFDRTARKEEQADAGGKNWLDRNGFTRSHPVNGERHRRIAEELEKWEALGRATRSEEIEGKDGMIPNPESDGVVANVSP